MTKPLTSLSMILSLLIAGWPVAAYDKNFFDITTGEELQNFYKENPDVLKKQQKYQEDIKRRAQQNQDVPEAALQQDAQLDQDDQSDPDRQTPSGSPESYMQDLIAEYKVEKGQMVEENIWTAAEQKADHATRQLYRDFLRKVYYSGHSSGDDTGVLVQYIRGALEKPDGWETFPREICGPPPIPGAAATYGGGLVTMGPGYEHDMSVHSHEWLHWWDDLNGPMDGQRGDASQVEPYAYANMGRYYG